MQNNKSAFLMMFDRVWLCKKKEHSEKFLLSVWATGTMSTNFEQKHSSNVLEYQTWSQNSAYTTR